jgi:DNA-binding CsgD family transcriptional regulator/PAS domain-containing protein
VTADLEPQRLSNLIGAIYDCTIDPDRWPDTMREICAEIECQESAIALADLEHSRHQVFRTWNRNPLWPPRHIEFADDIARYYKSVPALQARSIDEPLVSLRDVPTEVWTQSRFYLEWMKPQGFCDSIQILVLREPLRVGIFNAIRSERVGPVGDREIAILRLLAPHIRRSVTIGDVMDLKKIEVQALGAALDNLAAGVIVVAENNRILHANAAARAMFAAGYPIRAIHGRLSAPDANASFELSRAIDFARRNEAGIGATGIGVALNKPGGKPAVAHVLPLARGDIRTRLMPQATAAIFVAHGDGGPPANIAAVAQSFGLTPAETRFLDQLLRGGTLANAASAIGIAETTAKTHLSRIFAKTGVSRQADLVALIGRLALPPT